MRYAVVMRTADEMKRAAAEAAIDHVLAVDVLGVGSGSTVDAFIDALVDFAIRPDVVVAASVASEQRLIAAGFRVASLAQVGGRLPLYVDGADEADPQLRLIKGAGGAMLREKELATASDRFLCIIDESKEVGWLGGVPVPVEVLPIVVMFAAREMEALGGRWRVRERYLTDNGNAILDVTGLDLEDPRRAEARLDDISGAVANGVFAFRPADEMLVGTADGEVRSVVRERNT
jgi:ribose 5-phosphate isomerase A